MVCLVCCPPLDPFAATSGKFQQPHAAGITGPISKEAAIWSSLVGSYISTMFGNMAIVISMSLYSARFAASRGASIPAVLSALARMTAYGLLTHLSFELHNQVNIRASVLKIRDSVGNTAAGFNDCTAGICHRGG